MDAAAILDDTILYIAIAMIVGVVGLGIYVIYYISQFKHRIVIRGLYNERKVIQEDKFREYKDKDTGVKWFQLLKLKDKIPVAPKEAIEVTKKGKMFCEAYKTPTGEYVYLQDTANADTDFTKSEGFRPITTSQRVIQYHLFESKMRFKRKTWKDYIIPVAGLMTITMIAISLMIFWGDMAKPVLDMGDKMNGITQQQAEITTTLKEIIQKEQVLQNENPTETNGQSPPE